MAELNLELKNLEIPSHKAMKAVIEVQNILLEKSQINIISKKNTGFHYDLGVNLGDRIDKNENKILLIDTDPYEKKVDEEFGVWKRRVTTVHNSISRYKKIIATSKRAYKSIIFKHSQPIIYDEMPLAIRIAQRKIESKKIKDERVLYVVEQHPVYEKNCKKLLTNKNLEIIALTKGEDISEAQFNQIANSEKIYILTDIILRHDNKILDSEILSLSGIEVNVKEGAVKGTYNGSTIERLLWNIKSTMKSQYLNEKSSASSQLNDNIIYNYLMKHAS
jgi:hypothetical protein